MDEISFDLIVSWDQTGIPYCDKVVLATIVYCMLGVS